MHRAFSQRGFPKALKRLCSLKNQAQFMPHALETWTAVLSIFPTPVVNRALPKIGLSSDPFPDLCKVVIACQQAMPSGNEYAPSRDDSKVRPSTVAAAAKALGVEV